jgi:BCD family chlorophyll transporter-like MFS transporter
VQATAAGVAIASGGLLRDVVGTLAEGNRFGHALSSPATGYAAVYLIEIALLIATLVAVGPLVGADARSRRSSLNA